MNTQINKAQRLEFGTVNISHLGSILSICDRAKERTKNDLNLIQNKEENNINHFGLPLSVAHCGNQMLGYGFVSINTSGEIDFNYCFDEKEHNASEIKEGLELEAKKTFKVLFNDNATKENAVQNAIDKLANWINQC
ncbi:hypothetical protein [Flavobacterium hydatis]|uniref:Uncharacterized protein n=1 Tax=Flavobacterium hydatis TaxID=991 RepID=A0A086A7D0_FLAHY|nr:hypothetical protein [Flavobacterium hydatis]KFF12594.1 hypothetical protein IW20_18600 [Flavobacterium hydatis]OXA92041.1 hypothetical protein B0A62_16745 [Flavobacterium hydatis]